MTKKQLRIKQAAKNHNAPPLLPVKSIMMPIKELLTSPAMFAIEQASANPVAEAVPFKNVAGKLKNAGKAPRIAA